jgi:hypothetical protein
VSSGGQYNREGASGSVLWRSVTAFLSVLLACACACACERAQDAQNTKAKMRHAKMGHAQVLANVCTYPMQAVMTHGHSHRVGM